jgi:transposase-like protein
MKWQRGFTWSCVFGSRGAVCPTCASGERLTPRKNGFYRCNACQLDFTIRTGTIFERSHIPLHKWLYAMYLMVTARKSISSMQLAKEIGVTQKSAWLMLGRLHDACAGEFEKLRGVVEIEETSFRGKKANKRESKKLRSGREGVGKTAVMGLRERCGRTIARHTLDRLDSFINAADGKRPAYERLIQ